MQPEFDIDKDGLCLNSRFKLSNRGVSFICGEKNVYPIFPICATYPFHITSGLWEQLSSGHSNRYGTCRHKLYSRTSEGLHEDCSEYGVFHLTGAYLNCTTTPRRIGSHGCEYKKNFNVHGIPQ